MAGRVTFAALLAAAAVASAATAARTLLADPVRTPGVRNSAVTQRNIHETICVSGWTDTIRPPSSYTDALKLKQMREYHVRGTKSDYEEDHLISLELGGHPTSKKNLWPEPYPRARAVDVIERRLNRAVCNGTMTLRAAQREIARVKHEQG